MFSWMFQKKSIKYVFFSASQFWILLLIACVFFSKFIFSHIKVGKIFVLFCIVIFIFDHVEITISVLMVYIVCAEALCPGFWHRVIPLFSRDFLIHCFKLKIKKNKLFSAFYFTRFTAVLRTVPGFSAPWTSHCATGLHPQPFNQSICGCRAREPVLFSNTPYLK